MPKIGSRKISFRHEGILITHEVTIWYDSEYQFYIPLPSEYWDPFDMLDTDERKKFYLEWKGKTKGSRDANDYRSRRIVSDVSEAGTFAAFEKFVKYVADTKMERRAVIIVQFEKDSDAREENDTIKPKISMHLGLNYCIETKLPGREPKYYRHWDQADYFDEKVNHMKEEVNVRGWRGSQDVVIDDTPDNRAFLEEIYKAYRLLIDRMGDFTKSSEALIRLIESKQKLLPVSEGAKIE